MPGQSNSPGGSNHVVTTQLPQEHPWRRPGSRNAGMPADGRATRTQANDRRFAGPSVESGIGGLAMGARFEAANARAVHNREAYTDDGRSRRRSRGGRAAVMAGRPQRLCSGGGQTLSQSLRRHGPHHAPKSEIGGAVLPKWKEQPGMLGARVIFNNDVTIPWLTDGTADW